MEPVAGVGACQPPQERWPRAAPRSERGIVLQRINDERLAAALEKVGATDVYFSQAYLTANEAVFSATAECFLYTDAHSTVVYPYLKRPIPDSHYFDIVSPYGFGGYLKAPPHAAPRSFAGAFHEYCRGAKIVSEFVRFHPLLENQKHVEPSPVEVRFHQPVVVAEPQAIGLQSLTSKDVSKKVRKAREAGIELIDDEAGRFFESFVAQYHETMKVCGASRFYFFPDAFYRFLKGLLGQSARLLVARLEGQMVGGLLILHGRDFGYNFLSCSDPRFRSFGTNDLLQVGALEWARRAGMTRYLLGGGLHGEDSLFRYKARFAPGRAGFFLGQRIHLPEMYDELSEICRQSQGAAPEEFRSRSWFPLYRSQSPKENVS